MNFKKLIAALLSCLIFVVLLSSCSLTDYTLKGTWKELGSYVGLCQFNSDGTFDIDAVGYHITGIYEFNEGEQKKVDGKNTVEGTISMEYKDVTYTNEKGEEVTEPYTYNFVTTETEIVRTEEPNPYAPDKMIVTEKEVKHETQHKGTLTGPIAGTYKIVEQSTSAEALTIMLNDKVTIIDENGEKMTITPEETKWKFERSYDKI